MKSMPPWTAPGPVIKNLLVLFYFNYFFPSPFIHSTVYHVLGSVWGSGDEVVNKIHMELSMQKQDNEQK